MRGVPGVVVLVALVGGEAFAGAAAAQQVRTAHRVEAIRAAAGELRLDGRLDDAAWSRARPATGFVQREPAEGQPASEETEVRFAYDDDALWIGARMRSADPAAIRALVTRRDREGSSEQLLVSLDTYRDRRTAYTFGVTPAGVRVDYYHSSDFEDSRDYGFDPVWEAETSIDGQGWTAEMRIPFTQLRFSGAAEQEWGVNIVRLVPARNEQAYWVLVGRNETGWSSRMGVLAGIRGVRPSRGIEVVPYLAATGTFADRVDPADPFVSQRESALRAGADVKLGIGPSLTLDATFNPDFGQVEADPAEVNLTAYETFFDERRPFFTEGSQLFGLRGLFYSRRIGAPPPGSPDADFAERVENTTILGAAKLTGRFPSGLSVGALAAVTEREEVETFDAATGTFGSAVVAPLAAYGVASVQQEFGPNASTLSAMVTAVRRDLDPGSPLAALLTEEAYSGVVDGRLRWAGGKYDVSAYIGFTHVRGSEEAILRLQRSPLRYWQRPDADYVEVDPTRTTLTGTILGINHSKMAGAHWLWDIDYFQESPGLEPNDIGALGSADDRGVSANLRYRETRPGRLLRAWTVGLEQVSEWNFGGVRQFTGVFPFADFTLPNFWRIGLGGEVILRTLSDALTRGGPLMARPRSRAVYADLANSSGARTRWGVEVGASTDEHGGGSFTIEPELSLRPGARWELSMSAGWSDRTDSRQYVTAVDGGRAETFGRRYVFAFVDRSEAYARMRLNYTFTPDLTLETYVEPFASSGRFRRFGELAAARSGDLLEYGTEAGTIVRNADGSRTVSVDGATFTLDDLDFNVRSLRTNLVLRWEWRPGSTAYLVWQQDAFAERAAGRVTPGDVADAFAARGDHFLALKVSYWLPVR